MKLKKVISGGQTGVDYAALKAAKRNGIETGGWAPLGYRTLIGPNKTLATYGLKEHTSNNYPPRTALNVKESDATLRIFSVIHSPGEILTLKMILQYRKNHFDVWWIEGDFFIPSHEEVVRWLVVKKVETLNVAGNAESTAPGIHLASKAYLHKVFFDLRLMSKKKK